MRDFLPADVRKRNYVINIIKEVYESYGFEPLETPAVENIETLMGKYGDEGNQLIFRVLKRGDKLDKELQALRETGIMPGRVLAERITPEGRFADLALRYDLTVPFARVVANNKNDLPKFFKRYQIQPVWRADRPAKGRFREFYQCDVDVIGSESLTVEVELISAFTEVLNTLRFDDFIVRFNHRGVLEALLESVGIPEDRWAECLVILDKADKIGAPGVSRELGAKGFAKNFEMISKFIGQIHDRRKKLFRDFDLSEKLPEDFCWVEYNNFVIDKLSLLIAGANNRGGLDVVRQILALPSSITGGRIEFVPILARGLSYYTGAIMEIVLSDTLFPISLAGGRRYDGLIGMFGKEQIPACGFSLGLERILVVMEERGMFPPEIAESTPADVMVTIGSEAAIADSLKLASELRASGLRVTVYPQADKEDKQWKYANSIGVPWLCTVNETDIADQMVSFQNLRTRERFREPLQNTAARMRGE